MAELYPDGSSPDKCNVARSTEYKVMKGDAPVVRDRVHVNAGVTTCFVLSGEGTLEDLETSDARPDYVFRDVGAYTDYILHGSPEPVRVF